MNDKLKVVGKILSDLRSHLQRCVPDPADRARCERLCQDLYIQYRGTMDAWQVTLDDVSCLEDENAELRDEIRSLKDEIAGKPAPRRGS